MVALLSAQWPANSALQLEPRNIIVSACRQGNKTELTALLSADGLFSGAAKVGFNLAPKDVRFREMPWINTVVYNAGALVASVALVR